MFSSLPSLLLYTLFLYSLHVSCDVSLPRIQFYHVRAFELLKFLPALSFFSQVKPKMIMTLLGSLMALDKSRETAATPPAP